MKKNRKISFLCAILCMVMLFSLFSCQQAKAPEEDSTAQQQKEKKIVGYQVLEHGVYDIFDFGNHAAEVALWNSLEIDDPFAPERRSVTFNGKTYTGTYQRTMLKVPSIHPLRYYKGENVSFSVHKETGKLAGISFSGIGYAYDPDPTEEDAIAIAKEIASSCGLDLSTYKVSVSKSNKSYDFDYQISFYREVEGIRTRDAVYFALNRNGVLKNMHMYDVGSFDNISDAVAFLNMTAINEAIEKKLDVIYKDNPHQRSQHSRKDLLIRWTDGSCALVTEIKPLFKYDDSTYFDGFAHLLVLPIYEEVTE